MNVCNQSIKVKTEHWNILGALTKVWDGFRMTERRVIVNGSQRRQLYQLYRIKCLRWRRASKQVLSNRFKIHRR